jgi:hypothetical protein
MSQSIREFESRSLRQKIRELDLKMLSLRYQLGIYVVLLGFTPSFSAIAYDPLDCLKDVSKVDKDIIVGLATKLCSGAWTAEPVKCYAQVSHVDTTIPRGIAIDLCAGSADAENTLKCYKKAGERGLARFLATTLCGVRVPTK